MAKHTQYRSVIISDLHLGSLHSKAEEVAHFLKHIRCQRLILNGDIIDAWQLQRGGKWTQDHTRCIRRILTMNQKQGTQVVYIRGNHDDFLRKFMPLQLVTIEIVEDCILETATGKRYLMLHGDAFDQVVQHMPLLAHIGDVGYTVLLNINRIYNWYRRIRGKDYFSLSRVVKAKVKQAVSFIDKFEQQLAKIGRERNCQGIICGHIHSASDKQIEGLHYLNSGDWVESLTAIVEHMDGRMEVIDFTSFCMNHPFVSKAKEAIPEEVSEVTEHRTLFLRAETREPVLA